MQETKENQSKPSEKKESFSKALVPTTYQYGHAVWTGVKQGFGDIKNMVMHPWDHLVCPISSFVYDATIMMGHHQSPLLGGLPASVQHRTMDYDSASNRMKARVDGVKSEVVALKKASGPEATRKITRIATGVYGPGTFMKLAKGSNLSPKFGTFNPPLYRERRLSFKEAFELWRDPTPSIETVLSQPKARSQWVSIDDIRKTEAATTYAWVITKNGEFRAVPEHVGGHYMLTFGEEIVAGGDLYAANRRVLRIDNRSGDYVPRVEAAIVKHVLGKLGVSEVYTPGVIHEAYSSAFSREMGMRRGHFFNFYEPEPLMVGLKALQTAQSQPTMRAPRTTQNGSGQTTQTMASVSSEMASHTWPSQTPSEEVMMIFHSKSHQELQERLHHYGEKVTEHTLSPSPEDIAVTGYLNHFLLLQQEPGASYSTAQMKMLQQGITFDALSKMGTALERVALLAKNPELGKVFSVGANVFQAVSAASHYKALVGPDKLASAANFITAVSTILDTIFGSQDDQLAEYLAYNFGRIFEYLDHLSKETYEIKKFLYEFRKEWSESDAIYFNQIATRFIYQMEIMQDGFNQNTHDLSLTKSGIRAILESLEYRDVLDAIDYFEGIRDVNKLTVEKLEDILSKLDGALHQTTAAYRSGTTSCLAHQYFGSQASYDDLKMMLIDLDRQAELPALLACYYHLHTAQFPAEITQSMGKIIHVLRWSKLVEMYHYFRGLPQASDYDVDFIRLNKIEKQGQDILDFTHALQQHFKSIQSYWISDLAIPIVNKTLAALAYPERAHLLTAKYPLPDEFKAILESSPPDALSPPNVPNEFLAMNASGYGYFKSQFLRGSQYHHPHYKGCPLAVHTFDDYVRILPESVEARPLYDYGSKIPENAAYFRYARIEFIYTHRPNETHTLSYNVGKRQIAANSGIFSRVKTYSCMMSAGNHKTSPLDIRRNATRFVKEKRDDFTRALVERLESTVPEYRQQLQAFSIFYPATLLVSGVSNQWMKALPSLSLPQSITPWIELYRADLVNPDLFSPLPSLAPEIKQDMQDFIHNLTNYGLKLNEAIDTHPTGFFKSHLSASVARWLLALDQLKQTLINNGVKGVLRELKQTAHIQQQLIEKADLAIADLLQGISRLQWPISQHLIEQWQLVRRHVMGTQSLDGDALTHAAELDEKPLNIANITSPYGLHALLHNHHVTREVVEAELVRLTQQGEERYQQVVNAFNESSSALTLAIEAGRDDLVELLLNYDAQITDAHQPISTSSEDTASQRINALLDFYGYLQSFQFMDSLRTRRIFSLMQQALAHPLPSLSVSENKKIILLLGHSGAGKSSWVNYLSGVDYAKDRKGLTPKTGTERARVGRSMNSMTRFPEAFVINEALIALDTAGFDDTRGLEHNIVNGMLMESLANRVSKIGAIVFVCKVPTQQEKNRLWVDHFQMLANLIHQNPVIMDNVIFLVNEDVRYQSRSQEETLELFKDLLTEFDDLPQSVRFLLEHLQLKNIWIADFTDPARRVSWLEQLNDFSPLNVDQLKLASFHQYAERFKQLLIFLENYQKNNDQSYQRLGARWLQSRLQTLVSVNQSLANTSFVSSVHEGLRLTPPREDDRAQLKQSLFWQAMAREQLLHRVIEPMLQHISIQHPMMSEEIPNLSEVTQIHHKVQTAETFLARIKALGFHIGLPVAEAISPNMVYYVQYDGIWEFNPDARQSISNPLLQAHTHGMLLSAYPFGDSMMIDLLSVVLITKASAGLSCKQILGCNALLAMTCLLTHEKMMMQSLLLLCFVQAIFACILVDTMRKQFRAPTAGGFFSRRNLSVPEKSEINDTRCATIS